MNSVYYNNIQKKDEEYKIGSLYLKGGSIYMLICVSVNGYTLINLKDGRYCDLMNFTKIINIIENSFEKLQPGSEVKLKVLND